jgi:hypothetical protein
LIILRITKTPNSIQPAQHASITRPSGSLKSNPM